MKIFFTASFKGKGKYQNNYDLIIQILKQQSIELISPELDNYLELLTKERKSLKNDSEEHYFAIKKCIDWADAVIIEMSEEDFQLGYEAATTVSKNKKLLCLSIYEDFSRKISSPFFFGHKYTKYNLREYIENFLERCKDQDLTERINLFISKKQLGKIKNASEDLNINMSEYIRKIIDQN